MESKKKNRRAGGFVIRKTQRGLKGAAGAVVFLRDFVVLFESLAKMIQVGIANVLDGKVVDNESKHDGAPFVAPEPGGGGCLIVVEFGKAVSEEFVGKDACLEETVHAGAYLKVDPRVTGKLVELILVDEFLEDVRKLDAEVLWSVEQVVKIEVLEVHGGKPGITLGENTVDKQFSGIHNVVAAKGDARAAGVVSFLRSDLANNLAVGDFSATVGCDLVVGNGEEGVGVFDALAFVGTGADTLA